MGRYRLQNVLGYPPLDPHEARLWDADGSVSARWSGYLVGYSSLLNPEHAVGIDLAMGDFLQEIRGHIGKVGQMVEREDHRQVGMASLHSRRGRD